MEIFKKHKRILRMKKGTMPASVHVQIAAKKQIPFGMSTYCPCALRGNRGREKGCKWIWVDDDKVYGNVKMWAQNGFLEAGTQQMK